MIITKKKKVAYSESNKRQNPTDKSSNWNYHGYSTIYGSRYLAEHVRLNPLSFVTNKDNKTGLDLVDA